MSKFVVYVILSVFIGVGTYIPILFGWDDGFGVWSILGGFIGLFVGIVVVWKLASR